MSCRFCGKQFSRGYNLRRHEKEYCPQREELQEMYQTDSDNDEMLYAEDDTQSSSSEPESLSATDDEPETEDEIDPWIPLIEEARERSSKMFEDIKENLINNGLDEESARNEAVSNILPKLQKELGNIYIERLLWLKALKKDPVHKKIMHTKDSLVENDDFDPEEALEAAVDKRKFLMRKLLKNFNFDNQNNEEGEDNDI